MLFLLVLRWIPARGPERRGFWDSGSAIGMAGLLKSGFGVRNDEGLLDSG